MKYALYFLLVLAALPVAMAWEPYVRMEYNDSQVWTMIDYLPPQQNTTLEISNASSKRYGENGTAAFLLYDEFDDASISSQWSVSGDCTESGGSLSCGDGVNDFDGVQSVKTFNVNTSATWAGSMPATGASTHDMGYGLWEVVYMHVYEDAANTYVAYNGRSSRVSLGSLYTSKYNWSIKRHANSTCQFYRDWGLESTQSSCAGGALPFRTRVYDAGDSIDLDYVYVRNLAPQEPELKLTVCNGDFCNMTFYNPNSFGLLNYSIDVSSHNLSGDLSIEHNYTPGQVENLTASPKGLNWINLDWDVQDGTNHSFIWRNGTQIAITSDSSYNDTSLDSGTTYNYVVYAGYAGETNTSTSTENNITTSTYINTSLDFLIYDEIRLTLLTVNTTINIINDEGDVTSNLNSTNGNHSTVQGLRPDNYTVKYSGVGYGIREFYITVSDDTSQSFDLYLINESESSILPIKITDLDQRVLSDAEVHMQRWYDTKSSYETVEMVTSAVTGTNAYFEPFDAWYKFVTYYEDELRDVTTGRRYTTLDAANGITISIDVSSEPFESYLPVQYLTSNPILYNYDTQTFSWTYSDDAGILSQACLNITRRDRYKDTQVNYSCSTASSATLVAGHSDENKSFVATVVIDTNTENSIYYLTRVEEYIRSSGSVFGLFAAFIGIILIATLSLASGAHPAIPIIMTIIGLVASVAAFGVAIPYQTLVAISVVGIGIIFLMGWRVTG